DALPIYGRGRASVLRRGHRARTRADGEVIRWRSAAAAWQLERPDPGAPVERAVRGDVFARVPERASVDRVDAHRAVIAPAAQPPSGLRAGAVDDRPFALAHLARRLGGKSSGVVALRVETRARDAEAEADASGLIHRDAAHPAVARVGRVRPLLEEGEVAAARPELVPTNARGRTGGHAVVHHERLVVAEIAIGDPVHHAVGERVESLRGP